MHRMQKLAAKRHKKHKVANKQLHNHSKCVSPATTPWKICGLPMLYPMQRSGLLLCFHVYLQAMSKSHIHNILRLFACAALMAWFDPFSPALLAQEPAVETAPAPAIVEETVTSKADSRKPIQTSADSMDMDKNTGEIVLRGHVVLTHGDEHLLADQAQVNTQTRQAHAEGHVRLRKGYKEWISESLDYNFETGAMKAGMARADMGNGIFVQAKSMESADNKRYILKDSYFTTSDYSQPGFRMKASSIILYPNDRIALHNLVVYAGSVPVFYFPYFVFPLDDNDTDGFNTGTNVQVGSKSNWGFFVLNSYTTRLSEDLRPTFRLDYRSDRGLAGGMDLRYRAGEKRDPDKAPDEWQPRVSGKIRTYYADDAKVRKGQNSQQLITPTGVFQSQKIQPERYQVRVTQRADLTDEIYSKLKLNKLSDANFLEVYYEKEFQKDPQPDNFLEITKWSPNTTLSLLTRPQVNKFYTTTERLPELHYDFKRQSILGSPFFYESETSVSSLAKKNADFLSGVPDYNAKRVDTFHQFLYPKQYFEWLNFTPRIGGRATFYDRTPTANQASLLRGVFNTGFETGFKTTRTWSDVKNKKWEIDGLRHVIEPSVNYAFVARPTAGPGQIYQFDVDRSSSGINRNLTPIDFPQYTGIDSINKMNVFRPAIRQRLQTKRDGQTWDLAEFLVYQDFRVSKVDGQKTLSDLFVEFSTKPTRWLNLGWTGRYDENKNQLRESNFDFTVYKGKSWKLSLSDNYFRSVGNQLGINYAWAINENWTLRTNHRLDPTSGSLFEQSYTLDRDLHSWIASLSVSQLCPINRDPDLRVWLTFTLKAFPEVAVDSSGLGGGK